MVKVGDRVELASRKIGQEARTGVVVAVAGTLLTIRWGSGEESTLIPGPGSMRVVQGGGRASKNSPAKKAPAKTATAKKVPAKKAPAKKAPAKKAAKASQPAKAQKAAPKKATAQKAPAAKKATKKRR
jgi:hypothetical protein